MHTPTYQQARPIAVMVAMRINKTLPDMSASHPL
jgi:hypothetical protein